jgi:hypothetical protein
MNLAWHAFFGVDGSNMVYYHHCTEVLQGYLLFSSISGTKNNMVYYLAGDIYPGWATIVQINH